VNQSGTIQRMGGSRSTSMLAALVMLILLSLAGCSPAPPTDPEMTINLRWVRNYPKERRQNVDTGLFWALSFLGAELPESAQVLSWHGDVVTVDLGAAKVQEGSAQAWKKLLKVFKSSDEYRKMGAIDIGRFVFVSLCGAHQYYALAGTSPTFAAFLAKHKFDSREFAVVESGVAHGNRLIDAGAGSGLGDVAFVAFEGGGMLRDASFHKEDVETVEFMKNGQLRFGLYDLDGALKAHTTAALTAAGKPSKCLWCHELYVNPPFRNVTDLPGFHTTQQFKDLVASRMRTVADYRKTLHSKVDFRKTQDHTNAENLYLSFAHPTATRLALEWKMPLAVVMTKLSTLALKPHAHSVAADDGILGDQLYDRDAVDPLAPYAAIRGPSDIREASSYEPDLIH
jgi:hypothetical protein